jgi:hypothetical protein
MMEVRTADNLDLGKHNPGYEWNAGSTPLRDEDPGAWLVKLRPGGCWVVIFRSINGPKYDITTFPLTDKGERAAKVMASKLVDIAWGREEPRFR